ncbi:MAG: hypothetical protein JO252_03120 [Planctomycetaceae bacterium]|nr:hypothetical protein [Planctomycetaceae bacterium]
MATIGSAGRTDPTNHAPEAAPSRGLPDLQTRLAGEMNACAGAARGWSVWTAGS